jgi:hypothetical protein
MGQAAGHREKGVKARRAAAGSEASPRLASQLFLRLVVEQLRNTLNAGKLTDEQGLRIGTVKSQLQRRTQRWLSLSSST